MALGYTYLWFKKDLMSVFIYYGSIKNYPLILSANPSGVKETEISLYFSKTSCKY